MRIVRHYSFKLLRVESEVLRSNGKYEYIYGMLLRAEVYRDFGNIKNMASKI